MSLFNRPSRTVADPTTEIDPALREEVEQPPAWMYEWHLSEGLTTPALGPELQDVHRTRLELMEAPVRTALSEAGANARVIDLACMRAGSLIA
ncbi:MAG: hypothetical protein ACRDLF_07005 [Solirubrobacteraceae bacterium]